ncbi:YpmS family protein [Kurthia massiliensis]|uniref:YpmS family protein n=1 Tax=Kurthia massiliensis TaxID=1033739 RepID=UPI000288B193|nr:YpmS family protein [Kurthia massiliensis]
MNKWKIAFFTLLALIVIGFIALFIMITSKPEDQAIPTNFKSITGSEVTVQATADDFETLANHFISDATQDTQMPVKMYVDQDITLTSKVSVLGATLPVTMDFDPEIDKNGNLMLELSNIAVGILDIPTKTALKLVKDTGKLPNFITIQPNDNQAYINLNEINVPVSEGTNAHLRATKFDLTKDEIELKVIIPSN